MTPTQFFTSCVVGTPESQCNDTNPARSDVGVVIVIVVLVVVAVVLISSLYRRYRKEIRRHDK
ncbi:hypothetical protein [Glaciihabitans sp. UYNi722]|uniref:hypothetical protein n=1 Tax=Glaciihabitans sp. UYNi722 TaxID=3156344 RepID=UPI00339A2F48